MMCCNLDLTLDYVTLSTVKIIESIMPVMRKYRTEYLSVLSLMVLSDNIFNVLRHNVDSF